MVSPRSVTPSAPDLSNLTVGSLPVYWSATSRDGNVRIGMAAGSRQYGDIPMKGATMVLTPPEPSDINDMAKNTPHEAKLVWTTCGRELMNRMRAPIRVILGWAEWLGP